MTSLSPAAQSTLDAVRIHWEDYPIKDQQWCIACALRAIADTALPRNARGFADRQKLRAYILSIADELEGQ